MIVLRVLVNSVLKYHTPVAIVGCVLAFSDALSNRRERICVCVREAFHVQDYREFFCSDVWKRG